MIEIQTLKVKEICESPMNPRTKFEKADIEELAKNIRQQGLLQPITVRPIRDVDGEPVVSFAKMAQVKNSSTRLYVGQGGSEPSTNLDGTLFKPS